MNKIKGIFIGRRSGIRLGWLLLTAAVMYALAAAGVYALYWNVYKAMMEIWCVTSENVVHAPGWVQFLYSWSNVIVQLLESAVMVGFAAAFDRLSGVERKTGAGMKEAAYGAGLSAGCIVLIWLILLLTGSVRLGWKLSRPDFSVNTLALLLTNSAAAIAEGCFFYGAVYRIMKKRLPMWAALIGAAALITLMEGSIQPVVRINSYIASFVCCLLAEKYGAASAIGFRFIWDYLDQAVFGFAGSAAALYETYPVNLYWLSGGNGGIMNGMLTTFILVIAAFFLMRRMDRFSLPKMKKRSKSPS